MNKCFLSFLIALAVGIGTGYFIERHKPMSCLHYQPINETLCSLRRAMDKLWIEHLIWSHQLIVSMVANLPDVDATTTRLLQNQDDIGALFAIYYGDRVGNDLAKLLREHITIAADVFKATLAGNDIAIKSTMQAWYKNAADTAQFLNTINPMHWNREELQTILIDHCKGAARELNLRMNNDWAADVINADKSFDGAQEMGKYCAEGIAKQFPEKIKE